MSSVPASTPVAPAPHKFKGFNVPTILAWKDPVKTATLFGEVFFTWFFVSSSFALRLFLRLTFYLLALLSVLEIATRFINGNKNGIIGTYRPSRFLPREQAIQNISTSIAKSVRCGLHGIEHLLDTQSPVLNLQIAFASWFLYKVLGLVTVRTLALIAIISAFVLPSAYLQFKPQVDEAITQAQVHLSQQQAKLEKIAHEKAGSQIQFVKKFTNTSRNRGGVPDVPGHSASTTTAHTTGATTGSASAAPITTGATTTASHPTTEEVLNTYGETPSLVGNVKLDKSHVDQFQTDAQSLRDSIQKDKSFQ